MHAHPNDKIYLKAIRFLADWAIGANAPEIAAFEMRRTNNNVVALIVQYCIVIVV